MVRFGNLIRRQTFLSVTSNQYSESETNIWHIHGQINKIILVYNLIKLLQINRNEIDVVSFTTIKSINSIK